MVERAGAARLDSWCMGQRKAGDAARNVCMVWAQGPSQPIYVRTGGLSIFLVRQTQASGLC
jgi:hypothetical protein